MLKCRGLVHLSVSFADFCKDYVFSFCSSNKFHKTLCNFWHNWDAWDRHFHFHLALVDLRASHFHWLHLSSSHSFISLLDYIYILWMVDIKLNLTRLTNLYPFILVTWDRFMQHFSLLFFPERYWCWPSSASRTIVDIINIPHTDECTCWSTLFVLNHI